MKDKQAVATAYSNWTLSHEQDISLESSYNEFANTNCTCCGGKKNATFTCPTCGNEEGFSWDEIAPII